MANWFSLVLIGSHDISIQCSTSRSTPGGSGQGNFGNTWWVLFKMLWDLEVIFRGSGNSMEKAKKSQTHGGVTCSRCSHCGSCCHMHVTWHGRTLAVAEMTLIVAARGSSCCRALSPVEHRMSIGCPSDVHLVQSSHCIDESCIQVHVRAVQDVYRIVYIYIYQRYISRSIFVSFFLCQFNYLFKWYIHVLICVKWMDFRDWHFDPTYLWDPWVIVPLKISDKPPKYVAFSGVAWQRQFVGIFCNFFRSLLISNLWFNQNLIHWLSLIVTDSLIHFPMLHLITFITSDCFLIAFESLRPALILETSFPSLTTWGTPKSTKINKNNNHFSIFTAVRPVCLRWFLVAGFWKLRLSWRLFGFLPKNTDFTFHQQEELRSTLALFKDQLILAAQVIQCVTRKNQAFTIEREVK